ncbi:MAG TPA: methyl-accepting chemotaxis protein [Myxococcota bacterium]|nr:methyl-accepting chemotaxis protein [Myxococcota bacterium]HRY92691.1 methyl-accepting chemotaxis protein [Myxococcota bacterium]
MEYRRAHLLALSSALATIILVALLSGALERIFLWAALIVVVLAAPMFFLQTRLVRWMLEPAAKLLGRAAGEEAKPTSVRRALGGLDVFAFRDGATSLLLWTLGTLIAVALLALLFGLDGWQIYLLAYLGLAGALADMLLRYSANTRLVAGLRVRLEALLPPGEGWRAPFGHLSRRLTAAALAVTLIGLGGLGAIVLSRLRLQRADELLAARYGAVERAQRELEGLLRKSPDLEPGAALEQLLSSQQLRTQLLVLGARGQVLAGQVRADKTWLQRIVALKARSWLELQAPFLFLARPLTEQRLLVWVGDVEEVNRGPLGLLPPILLGVGLMAALGLLLMWSVTASGLRPLTDLTQRVRRASEGNLDAGLVAGGQGEVAELQRAVAGLSGHLRTLAADGHQALGQLEARMVACQAPLDRLRQGGEGRQASAEKTASSVIEMRSAIQGITEQVEALRGSASDCSSALMEIDQSVREVSGSASSFQGMMDDTASAMREIARSVQEVAGHVEDLARRATDAVGAIGLMDAAIRQVEGTTRETRELTHGVADTAGRGVQSVRETIVGIEEIQKVTEEARQVIHRLGTRMDEVGKILVVIGDVAEKTNLLALNAAIIAAAAGEHGRAFGVVADEIKDLADRTATSTKEIAALIKTVQADSRMAMEAIERGTSTVRRGAQVAQNAGLALAQIQSAVAQVSARTGEVARNTSEHTQLAHRITQSMGEISSMVRDIRRAMEEQTLATARVDRTSEQMREDARFIGRSASEQVQAVSGVAGNMERMNEMVGFIAKAMSEQGQGVSHVAEAAEELRDSQSQESAVVLDAMESLARLKEALATLRAWLGRLQREGEPKA